MPPARKASTKKARPKKARPASRTTGARKRFEDNDRVIRRITKSLDVALDDLAKVGGSVGAGAGELRRDLAKMLRDTRRHATKMGNATRKDLDRLQKDMTAAAKNSSGRRTARKSRTASSSKTTRASSTARRKARTGATAKKARSTTKAKVTRKASPKSRAAR
jgi:hypothetical protein